MLGKELEIVAVPSKSSGPTGVQPKLASFLSLHGTELLPGFPEAAVSIEPLDRALVGRYLQRGGHNGSEDWDHAIRFSLRINKATVAHFLDLTRETYPEGSSEAQLLKEPKHRETKGVVFSGLLYRRFRDLFLLCVLVSNIADYKSFPILRGYASQFGRPTAWDAITASWAVRPALPARLGMQALSAPELLAFFRAKDEQLRGIPRTPLFRALANYSYVYSAGGRSFLTQLFWSLAAVEALLNPGGRSVRAQIEERLKVIFAGKEQANVISDFKKLYEYRSTMSHGALDIPLFLNDRMSGFLDFPVDQAEFASALAIRLMQLCFERRSYEFKFTLSLLNPGQ